MSPQPKTSPAATATAGTKTGGTAKHATGFADTKAAGGGVFDPDTMQMLQNPKDPKVQVRPAESQGLLIEGALSQKSTPAITSKNWRSKM